MIFMNQMNQENKLKIEKIIIFKHGIGYFLLKGTMKGTGTFELEFTVDEMNDILKSLFVLDTSEDGFISSISYDAALEPDQLLKNIMIDIPNVNSFTSLITQLKGAKIMITIGRQDSEKKRGIIMGMEEIEKIKNDIQITEKLLVLLLEDTGKIVKIPFSEISEFDILNKDIKSDLKFFLDTIISGIKKDSKKIIINCESGGNAENERTIVVSYLHESPIWKTSYRLIMSKEQAEQNKCLLAGYSLIENITNQDWEDIELTLVAGMPVSFIYDFYRPILMQRPVIEPPKVLSAKPTEIEEEMAADEFRAYRGGGAPKMKKEATKQAMEYEKAPMAPARAIMTSPDTSISGGLSDDRLLDKMRSATKTQTKELGELFEYKISNPVTIKRKKSALVPILTEGIKAKKILLYNKTEHDKNPNACLEITNNSALTLEHGPVSIIYDDNLAGESIIPFMNKDDTRLLNYAIEQGVLINTEQKTEDKNVHKVTFGGAYCYEYYYTLLNSSYKIKNKTEETKELYIDHPKKSDYKITEKPQEPEETANYWRFKLVLQPKSAIEFKLQERKENYSSYYIWNWTKKDILNKISFYMKKQFIEKELESSLKEIAQLIGDINQFRNRKSKLENEQNQMTSEQERLRENISVLGDSTQEASLKEKYVNKLTLQENRFEEIKAEIDELEKQINKLNEEIEEKLNNLKSS
jgi:hypothetical protein